VIPIDRLTEADQRWMVSAEYGGTGGQPLQGGMCVEEPDIEIGQGVSSKGLCFYCLFCFLIVSERGVWWRGGGAESQISAEPPLLTLNCLLPRA
jgi:hypothetical protein